MNRMGRSTNRFGITDDAPQLKVIVNPVPTIKLQFAQLTQLLEEYQGRRSLIDNRTDLSSIGKDPLYSDLKADFNRRLKNMKADPSYSVAKEITATQAALVPEVPTTGDALLDEMRDREIRDTIRRMNSAERVEVVMNSAEILTALLNSPVPFGDFPVTLIEEQLERIGREGKKSTYERIDDLEEIQKTRDVNWMVAERFIQNPTF